MNTQAAPSVASWWPTAAVYEATGEEIEPWTRSEPVDQARGRRRARAAVLLELALPGVAYIDQGDELGLPEILDLPSEARRDPTCRRTAGADVGRDGTRVPIPWARSSALHGFGPADSVPWLPQPDGWGALSVAARHADRASVQSLYRTALAIRRDHPGLAGKTFRWIEAPGSVLHFEREAGFRCALSFGDEPFPSGAAVLARSDGPAAGGPLPCDAAARYLAR